MALRTAKPPAAAFQAVSRALADLASVGRQSLLGGSGAVQAADNPLPVYVLTLDALGLETPLASARQVGWRYIVRQGRRFASADARMVGRRARFARLSQGPLTEALIEAAGRAETLAGAVPGEARILEVPALNSAALWLADGVERFLRFGPDGAAEHLVDAATYLGELREAAARKQMPAERASAPRAQTALSERAAKTAGRAKASEKRAARTRTEAPMRRAISPPSAAPVPRQISTAHSRMLTILAQDPAVRLGQEAALAFTQVEVPAEELAWGPTGYRVKVVDYDASAECLYLARAVYRDELGNYIDPYARRTVGGAVEEQASYEARLLGDPNFHAQNVYAIVMRTLARFEKALGRRVSWSFDGHQLHVAPHAFCEANAFYSEQDRALLFGYFRGTSGKIVHTCLSHDVVAHETTHALLDGLRNRFTEISLPDQAALHEGFADVVALLSMFSLEAVVAGALQVEPPGIVAGRSIRTIPAERLTPAALRQSILLGLAEQVGSELDGVRGKALRRSVEIEPNPAILQQPIYQEAHMRGEIFAAAMMGAFLNLWSKRIESLGTFDGDLYNLDLVVAEGAKVGDHLLTMVIRALDYCPPTDIDFDAYLAALLTADAELVPDDCRYRYRASVRESFAAFGIDGPQDACHAENGTWKPFDPATPISYARSNFESMLRDKDEVFRFIWDNRAALAISERSYIEVASVRLSQRVGPDGFVMRETVCEYVETAQLFASETEDALGTKRPNGMPTTTRITAYGGGAIIFDQYGRIKYHIVHGLKDGPRQLRRLEYLYGGLAPPAPTSARERFALLHRARAQEDRDVQEDERG